MCEFLTIICSFYFRPHARDEPGEWTVLVVIEDQLILGKTITVEYRLLDDLVHGVLPRYGLLIASPVLAAIIFIVMVRRRSMKKREMNRPLIERMQGI